MNGLDLLLANHEVPVNNEVDLSVMTPLKDIIGEAYTNELADKITQYLRGECEKLKKDNEDIHYKDYKGRNWYNSALADLLKLLEE